jgi:hypothetical protein
MVSAAEAGQTRWLLKAVREASGELFSQFAGINEAGLRWRPTEREWCLKEVAAHLRDAELLYQRQIELIAREPEPRLPYEAIDVLPSERDYSDDPIHRLLQEYEEARQETVWLLRTLDEDDWQRCGIHPYRGRVSAYDIARELHQHDLEHLYQARRLHEALVALR